MSTATLTLEITGMHCPSCALLIDDCMEDVDGVLSSRTSLKTGLCVAVVESGVTETEVLAAVAEAGYVGTVVGAVPA